MARYRHDDPHQTKMIAVSYRAIFHQLCNQQKWVGQRPLPNTHQPANQQTTPHGRRPATFGQSLSEFHRTKAAIAADPWRGYGLSCRTD